MANISRNVALGMMAWALLAPPAFARDYVLVLGGGPTPDSSQISIEQNAVYFQRIFPKLGLHDARRSVLFAAGELPVPDVCYNADIPTVNRALAELFDGGNNLGLLYRRHDVPGVESATTRSAIFAKLDALAKDLRPNDRVLIYLTGHGGKGNPLSNSHFYTWTKETINVRDFAAALDKFDPNVSVLLVMVQCYGGAFANVIYKGGNPDEGLAPHHRCGFFATLESRPAAGCTSDIRIEDYHEYSTYFWAALAGEDRTGKRVRAIDLDGDDRVSALEAHAYALIESPTIDISIRASEQYLRKVSSLTGGDSRFLRHDHDYSRLLGVASPVDRAVLEALTRELKLAGEDRVAAAIERAGQIEAERKSGQQEINQLRQTYKNAQNEIARTLRARWPFIANAWHPATQELLNKRPSDVMSSLRREKRFGEWNRLRGEIAKLQKQDLAKEKQWAKLQRVIRAAENATLAYHLTLVGDAETQKRYAEMTALESEFLHCQRVAAESAAAPLSSD